MNLRLPGVALLVALVTTGWLDGGGGRAWSDSTSKPTIKLLEAGAEPRAVLRFRGTKGRKERGSGLTVKKDLLGDDPRKDEQTTVSVTLTVEEVTKTLDTRYALTLDKLDYSPLVQMDELPSAQRGTVVNFTVDERGTIKSREIVPPKRAPASLYPLNAMENLENLRPPPFPAEAVGLGARWEVVTELRETIWTGQITTVCTLKARKESRVEVNVEITQSAKPQKQRFGTFRSELLAFAGSGSGHFELDLDGVLPLQGTTTVVTEETHRATSGKHELPTRTIKWERKIELSGGALAPEEK